jgi:P4 family phage/plasmid primase-like protien
MPFPDYSGSKFVPYLLPIIPRDATLSPASKLTPDKLGKIPGWRRDDGWAGFAWQKHRLSEGQLRAYEKMYGDSVQTIGLQASKFPGLDLDVSVQALVDALRVIAEEEMGETIYRGRENSARVLLMYRASEGEDALLMRKMRHVYKDPNNDDPKTWPAIEWLAHGQQYLIEGQHQSGVPYEWEWGTGPLQRGYDNLVVVTPEQVEAFFARADALMAFAGYQKVTGGDSMRMTSTISGALHEIGPNHPELCRDLDMLKDVLENYLPVDHDEFTDYQDWENFLMAVATACGKDEQFYDDVVVPWNSANPDNDEETLRGKWESYRQTSIGWSYITNIAHDYRYTADVEAMMPALPDDPNRPDQSPQPSGPPRNGVTEQALADQFVSLYARKKWIHVPAKAGGHWRRCDNGIWIEDPTAPEDAGRVCAAASDAIRSSGNATPAQLIKADTLMSAHSQDAVIRIAKARSAISVPYVKLDNHPLIMGVPGGFIDEEGRLRDPDPGMLLTRTTGVRPDFDALSPLFDQRVLELANHDKNVAECLWGLIGYTACGLGDQQKFAFLHGAKGNEGKTTFFTILALVFGAYSRTFKPEIFMRGQDNRFSIASFDGAWFAYGSEIDQGVEWSETNLKSASGGGKAPAEKKFMDPYEMWLRFLLWFAGNSLPRFRGNDQALRRRAIVFECMEQIAKVVSGYDLRVFNAEGGAILAKAVRYRQNYIKSGELWIAPAVQGWTDAYFEDQDKVGQYIDERVDLSDPEAQTERHVFFDDYRVYVHGELGSDRPLGRNNFFKAFEEHAKLKRAGAVRVRTREGDRNTNPLHRIKGAKLRSAFEVLSP